MTERPEPTIYVEIGYRRDLPTPYREARDSFWASLFTLNKVRNGKRAVPDGDTATIDALEAAVERVFGPQIRGAIVHALVGRQLDLIKDQRPKSTKFERLMRSLTYHTDIKAVDGNGLVELAQNELQFLRELEATRSRELELLRDYDDVSGVFVSGRFDFAESPRIVLTIAPLWRLAKAFKGELTALRLLIDAAAPGIFLGAMPAKFKMGAETLKFTTVIPPDFTRAFHEELAKPTRRT